MSAPRWIMAGALMLAANSPAGEYIVLPDVKGEFPPPTEEWSRKIAALAPDKPTAAPATPRKVLVFSLTTGFVHKVAPHVKELIRVLGDKSGAFEVEFDDDIEVFEKERLERYDAIVLNNVCPKGPGRDLFSDVLGDDRQTARLEANLINYVRQGGGLAVIHGAIAFQLNSEGISGMIGGSFDWHPKFQTVTLELVDPGHPLVAGFEGRGFVHRDEPYFFKNAYAQKNFRPLLMMDVAKLDPDAFKRDGVADDIRYIAWIKRHGKGRIFFCSPSHHPASYEHEVMLRFLLDGMQYVLGDLACDDSPIGTP